MEDKFITTTDVIGQAPTFTPSQFIAVANQTLEYVFPLVIIVGELSSYNVSKNKWVYFDIKDESSKVKCFGTIFQINTLLEEGMQVEVVAQPRLHNLYGFSLNIKSVRPVGEGSIKKAADLLHKKLEAEGLFASERKRSIPYAPSTVGLIASEQSAGYVDFIKILNVRWQGVEVEIFDAQVQGEASVESVISGIHYFSQMPQPPEVLVITRGGGSADDLASFSAEPVVRAVAACRIPTVVAIGHEVDVSLAELAADLRASTPSNAAELLFPDKADVLQQLQLRSKSLADSVILELEKRQSILKEAALSLSHNAQRVLEVKAQTLRHARTLLESVHPTSTLKRGYALIQLKGKLVSSVKELEKGSLVDLTMKDGSKQAEVQ